MTPKQEAAIDQLQALLSNNFSAGVISLEGIVDGAYTTYFCQFGSPNACVGLSQTACDKAQDTADGTTLKTNEED